MSTQPISGAAALPSGALAAGERIQRLQALIAQVEQGPAGFAAALDAAQSTPAAGQSATASASSAGAYPSPASSYPSTGLYASTAATAGTYPGIGQSSSYPAISQTPYSTAAPTTVDGAGISSAGSVGGSTGAYDSLIDQAAARNGVDPAVLHGLIQQESGFDPNATSSAGALGLTQLMPGTAASLGVTEPLNPAQSIAGGARYLGQLLKQFGGNTANALAAYNAGPGAVQRYGGVPPYPETQQYVTKVLDNAAAYRQGGASATPTATAAPGTIT